MNQIKLAILEITADVEPVANKIIEMGILSQKNFDDCQHIGHQL